MVNAIRTFSTKQLVFKELFVGTLVYAVVLGFYNDYTSIVYAKSFSSIFLASVVLQILTSLVFLLKRKIVHYFRTKDGKWYKVMLAFTIWFILFISKFIFIWALDVLFGDYINIKGFFGILLVVLTVTILVKLSDYVFDKLQN